MSEYRKRIKAVLAGDSHLPPDEYRARALWYLDRIATALEAGTAAPPKPAKKRKPAASKRVTRRKTKG